MIIGSDGLIGKYFSENFEKKQYDIKKTTHNSHLVNDDTYYLNLLENNSIDNLNIKDIDVVLFFASKTNQRFCEDNSQISYQINVLSTLKLIKRLCNENCSIIFPSTSLVFDGKNPFPKANDTLNPIGNYAKYKMEVEKGIKKINYDKITIIRISKIIDNNFYLFTEWVQNLMRGKKIHPFSDLLFSPISILFLFKVINKLIIMNYSGVINLSAKYDISYFDASKYLSKKLNYSKDLISPCFAKEVIDNLHLPKYASLDTSQLKELGLLAPNPYKALDDFVS